MKTTSYGIQLALVLIALACSDSSGPVNPDIDGTLTATIAGDANFAGDMQVSAWLSGGELVVQAQQAHGEVARGISLYVANVTSAGGTFSIGAGNPGNRAFYSESTVSTTMDSVDWYANESIGSGQIVVAHLTTSHVFGTFSFTALPFSPTATGNKVVTGGTFSITLSPP